MCLFQNPMTENTQYPHIGGVVTGKKEKSLDDGDESSLKGKCRPGGGVFVVCARVTWRRGEASQPPKTTKPQAHDEAAAPKNVKVGEARPSWPTARFMLLLVGLCSPILYVARCWAPNCFVYVVERRWWWWWWWWRKSLVMLRRLSFGRPKGVRRGRRGARTHVVQATARLP